MGGRQAEGGGRAAGRRLEGGRGQVGRRAEQRGGRKFYLGAELIKCIDPNEGEALRRGSTFKPGGGVAPPAPLFRRLWGVKGLGAYNLGTYVRPYFRGQRFLRSVWIK